MSQFRLSKEALADIREIRDYIWSDNPEAADRVLSRLYEAFVLLARTPAAGHARHDLTRRNVLFWPVRSYLIVYAADVRPLSIVAVLHGKRDVRKLLRSRLLQQGKIEVAVPSVRDHIS